MDNHAKGNNHGNGNGNSNDSDSHGTFLLLYVHDLNIHSKNNAKKSAQENMFNDSLAGFPAHFHGHYLQAEGQ